MLVNLVPFGLIQVFNMVIMGISAQYFMSFLNIYFPLYPTGATDTYSTTGGMQPAMLLFSLSFMWTATMYILGTTIASKYDGWASLVNNGS